VQLVAQLARDAHRRLGTVRTQQHGELVAADAADEGRGRGERS
jgi:hypothetical protein